MKSILQWIQELPEIEWNYYEGIDNSARIEIPFTGKLSYSNFIRNFFRRGEKVSVFKESGIDVDQLHRPNHICSVFFLGVLVYYRTAFQKRYSRPKNEPGYRNFPFVWFLIALFHDNAYQMEEDKSLTRFETLNELKQHFQINHDLLSQKFSMCPHLINARANYYSYRRLEMDALDHGILGGMLLYDRLVKIRREKKIKNEGTLFWGKKLENDYKLAANAISIHNIWLPTKGHEITYQKHGLDSLIGCAKAKFKDFPLYYILSIVDTLEPLKEFNRDRFSDQYIFDNIELLFNKDSVAFFNKPDSKLDLERLAVKAMGLKEWLDIKVKKYKNGFELNFS